MISQFQRVKGQFSVYKVPHFTRVGRELFMVRSLPLLFAKRLFIRLEPVTFWSQKSNFTVATKTHRLSFKELNIYFYMFMCNVFNNEFIPFSVQKEQSNFISFSCLSEEGYSVGTSTWWDGETMVRSCTLTKTSTRSYYSLNGKLIVLCM